MRTTVQAPSITGFKIITATCLFLLLYSINGIAQTATRDTAFLRSSVKYAKEVYQKQLKSESPLHNGTEYKEYVSLDDEFPLFLSDDWLTGSVTYQDDVYENIPLKYDISTDKVITEHATSGRSVQLIDEHIRRFTVGEHHFVMIKNANIPTGFYDLLLQDKQVSVVAKRVKVLQKKVISARMIAEFEEINRYYYLKDGKFMAVKGKGAALDALSDERTQLKQQLRKNKIKFSKSSREQSLVEMAKLYNALKQQ